MHSNPTIEDFRDAQPWLVCGVIKGLSPLNKEQSFIRWLGLEINRILRIRHPSGDHTRKELELGLNAYADDCCDKADQAMCAVRTLFEEVFGVGPLPVKIWDALKGRLCFLYWYGQAEDWLKFHFNSLFCLATDQEMPTAPQLCEWGPTHLPGIFLGGRGYCILRRFVRQGLTTETASLLLAKKGMPSMQDWKVQKTLVKHREALTTREPNRQLDDLVREVIRTVDEVFPPKSRNGQWHRFASDLDQPFRVPSCSGHVTTSREDMGAYGFVQGLLGTIYAAGEDFDLLGLQDLFDHPENKPGSDDVRRGVNGSWGDLPGMAFEWDGASKELASALDQALPTSLERGQEMATRLLEWIWTDLREEGPHPCRAVAIPEPLKVRVVTGGPELEYYVASYIQKLVHSKLRRHSTFDLIGRPLNRDDIEYVLAGMWPGYRLVSADYKAATDGLEPALSVACATRIGQNLGFGQKALTLYCSTLVNHSISYEPLGALAKVWHRQTMGQLMGSPSSFPILCLVNAAVTRYSLELAMGRHYTLLETHMKVNGDDLLFPSPSAAIPVWEAQTLRCGLEKSPGKNYVSEKFCTLNSECYFVRRVSTLVSDYWTCDSCPAVNLGLLLGRNVKKGHGLSALAPTETFRFQDVAQMATDLIEGHDDEMKEKLMTIFIRSWSETLTKAPPGVSWWIPKCLGGLGLPWTRPHDPDLSRQQYKIAAWFASGCSVQEHMRRKALLQEKLGIASIWEEASKYLKDAVGEVGLGDLKFVDQTDNESLTAWLAPVVAVLFLNGFRPERLELDRARMLWANWFRVWRRGTAHGMPSLPWSVIAGYRGKTVEISLPRPPPEWAIRVDALSQKSVSPQRWGK